MKTTLLILGLMFASFGYSQEYYAIQEDFDNNSNEWKTLRLNNIIVAIDEGKYDIRNFSSRPILLDKAIAIDQRHDFLIEADVQLRRVTIGGFGGLIWGMRDYGNYFFFGINRKGKFAILRWKDGKEEVISDWKKEKAIRDEPLGNVLSIQKEGNSMRWLINGTEVYKAPFKAFQRGKVGFKVERASHFLVESFSVRQPTKNVHTDPTMVFETEKRHLAIAQSSAQETNPIPANNGLTLYFSREGHPENVGKDLRKDIWSISKSGKGEVWLSPQRLNSTFNNEDDNFVCSITPDGSYVFVAQNTFAGSGLFEAPTFEVKLQKVSVGANGQWAEATDVNIKDLHANYPSTAFFVTADGETMIMSVERDDTAGGKDLYVSTKKGEGQWSKPINLGLAINTEADEMSAYLTEDGKTLYFATQGHPGYGGVDIFKSERKGNGWTDWSKPINLGKAVNTAGNETGFYVAADEGIAYFASSAQRQLGMEIYEIDMPVYREPEVKEEEEAVKTVMVSQQIMQGLGGSTTPSEVIFYDKATGQEVARATPNADGKLQVALPAGKSYTSKSAGSGVVLLSDDFAVGESATQSLGMAYAIPVEAGNIIRIQSLNFDFDRTKVPQEALDQLDNLASMLVQSPQTQVEVAGHTDNIGPKAYNQKLSEKRAQAVADYLLEKGVKNEQLTIQGYGMDKPLNQNASILERKANRRVEFVLLIE